MAEIMRNTSVEFREYYIQTYAAKGVKLPFPQK